LLIVSSFDPVFAAAGAQLIDHRREILKLFLESLLKDNCKM